MVVSTRPALSAVAFFHGGWNLPLFDDPRQDEKQLNKKI
jgi:hypothetical protein